MVDGKILLVPLIGSGIFGLIMLIEWINVTWGIAIHLPLIQYIDPNTLSWIHFFEVDPTPFPYTFALAYFYPQLWWSMTIVIGIIISSIITIILIVFILG